MRDSFFADEPTAFVLDGDRAACAVVKALVRQAHCHAECYHSAVEFFETCDPHRPGCLLLDIHTPGLRGPQAVAALAERRFHLPVILLTARPEVAEAVRAIRAGAVNYLRKPCDPDELAEAIHEAIAWDAENRRQRAYCARARRRLKRLLPGERHVLEMLVHGRSNREIAESLGVSVRTIEVRRAKMMKKMRAQSLADVIRAHVAIHGPAGALQHQKGGG